MKSSQSHGYLQLLLEKPGVLSKVDNAPGF